MVFHFTSTCISLYETVQQIKHTWGALNVRIKLCSISSLKVLCINELNNKFSFKQKKSNSIVKETCVQILDKDKVTFCSECPVKNFGFIFCQKFC